MGPTAFNQCDYASPVLRRVAPPCHIALLRKNGSEVQFSPAVKDGAPRSLRQTRDGSLHYVPISSRGDIVPFGADGRRRRVGDVAAWTFRIRDMRISHVMSFAPASIEISWMDAHPESFTRVTGYEDRWALYRVIGDPVSAWEARE